MKFWVVSLCIVSLVYAKPVSEKNICIAQYLKTKGIIVEGAETSDEPLSPQCKTNIDAMKEAGLHGAFNQIFQDKKLKKSETCIRDGITKSHFVDHILAEVYYKTHETIDATLSLEKLKSFRDSARLLSYKAIISCTLPDVFGSFQLKKDDLTPDEDYCLRKRVIDKKLLKIANATLAINPEKVDITKIDCEVLFPEIIKKFEAKIMEKLCDGDAAKEDQIKCYLEIARDGNYYDQLLQFEFVKELKLSDAQKKECREDMIKITEKLLQESSKCFLRQ